MAMCALLWGHWGTGGWQKTVNRVLLSEDPPRWLQLYAQQPEEAQRAWNTGGATGCEPRVGSRGEELMGIVFWEELSLAETARPPTPTIASVTGSGH